MLLQIVSRREIIHLVGTGFHFVGLFSIDLSNPVNYHFGFLSDFPIFDFCWT